MRIIKRVLVTVLLSVGTTLVATSLSSPAAAHGLEGLAPEVSVLAYRLEIDAVEAEVQEQLTRSAMLRREVEANDTTLRRAVASGGAHTTAEAISSAVAALEDLASERVVPLIDRLRSEAVALAEEIEWVRVRATAIAGAMVAVAERAREEAQALAAAMLQMAQAERDGHGTPPTGAVELASAGNARGAESASAGSGVNGHRLSPEAAALVEFAEAILQEAETNSAHTEEAAARVMAEAEELVEALKAQVAATEQARERLVRLKAEIASEVARLIELLARASNSFVAPARPILVA